MSSKVRIVVTDRGVQYRGSQALQRLRQYAQAYPVDVANAVNVQPAWKQAQAIYEAVLPHQPHLALVILREPIRLPRSRSRYRRLIPKVGLPARTGRRDRPEQPAMEMAPAFHFVMPPWAGERR
jgi:hypothetical protein